MSQQLQTLIDNAWEERTNFSPKSAPADVRQAVADVIEQLNAGTLRVAQKDSGQWVVNQWVKKAVLLSACGTALLQGTCPRPPQELLKRPPAPILLQTNKSLPTS